MTEEEGRNNDVKAYAGGCKKSWKDLVVSNEENYVVSNEEKFGFRKEGKTVLFRQKGTGKISWFMHVRRGIVFFFFLQAGSIKIWMNIASYFQIKAKWELKH